MKRSNHPFLFIFSLLFIPLYGFSVITTTYNNNAQALAENIFSGSGILISNAKLIGSNISSGTFSGSSSISLEQGVLLGTGDISQAVGVNNSGSTTTLLNTDGDTDVDSYISEKSYDATVLEFDFITISDTISFDFVFGSEEYIEFVCESYNDIFLALLSGPGIIGNKNIALTPFTNNFISVNNIRPLEGLFCLAKNNTYYIDNSSGSTIQFDGYTTKINAYEKIIPCKTYHLKLVIADVKDRQYDSGVFIKGKTYTQKLPQAFLMKEQAICFYDTVTIQAVDSIGYKYLWSTGDTTSKIQVCSTALYWLEISDGLKCTIRDSIQIIKTPKVVAEASNEQVICNNDSLTIYASGGAYYNWKIDNTLMFTQKNTINFLPKATDIYEVYVSDECTIDTAYIKVNVLNCHVFIANAFSPNDDGKNDKICVHQIGLTAGRFIIFNRWGKKVYDNEDINACWVGESNLEGVYAYYFQGLLINNQVIRKKGNISLIR